MLRASPAHRSLDRSRELTCKQNNTVLLKVTDPAEDYLAKS